MLLGSLFTGIGGFCQGFDGIAETAWANELDKYAVETFRYNNSARCIHRDVRQLSVAEDGLCDVDIITGGFPCQSFSAIGRREGINDPRGQLFKQVIRIVSEMKTPPAFVILENVKGILRSPVCKLLIRDFEALGYRVHSKVLNTYSYTLIPQNRERVFFVMTRGQRFFWPEVTDWRKRHYAWDLLDTDRAAPCIYYLKPTSKYYHMYKNAINGNYIYNFAYGCIVKSALNLCPTLRATSIGGHHGPCIKDAWGIRCLTPAECSRFQGFRGKFPPMMPNTQRYKQLGNSVTVDLIRRLAVAVAEVSA